MKTVRNPAGQDVSITIYMGVQNRDSVISEVGVFMMPEVQFSAERRRQKRFKAAEGAFAALVDQESRLGQIKDISVRGLSFRYIDSNEKLENAKELKIILGRQGLYLDNVPFKKISDFEIIPLVIIMFRKKGWRHKCCSKKTLRNRNVFLTTTIRVNSASALSKCVKSVWSSVN